MNETTYAIVFWTAMVLAQAGAFIIFKDLADISQWVVQSSRRFTMAVWYHRHVIGAVSVAALLVALVAWWRQPAVCPGAVVALLVFLFAFNFYSGMFNPKLMFRSQQHRAKFVPVAEAEPYLRRSLPFAHFGPKKYASVDDIEMLVLETDHGAYGYTDYFLLQPHVVKGDTIGGEDVIMTYCGLTNLGIAYSPVIGDQRLDLTVMTQLKNNLVLFDRNSGEAIQQIWGTMERDPRRGRMREWPTVRMPFRSFRKLYPQGRVFVNEIPSVSEHPVLAFWDRLVRHGMMLWGVGLNWIENEKPAFPTIEYRDRRLPMKELVYTVSVGGDHVAYAKTFIIGQGNTVNAVIGGRDVVVDYDPELDVVAAFYNDTGAPVREVDVFGTLPDGRRLERVETLKSRIFWFIFIEFHPGADVNRVGAGTPARAAAAPAGTGVLAGSAA
jgi:hypothetical protein